MSILLLSCSNKPVKKNKNANIICYKRKDLKKEAYKFDCCRMKLGINGFHVVCIKITISKRGRLTIIIFLLKIKDNTNFKKILYEHSSFKTGYREKGTQKFLAVGGDYP